MRTKWKITPADNGLWLPNMPRELSQYQSQIDSIDRANLLVNTVDNKRMTKYRLTLDSSLLSSSIFCKTRFTDGVLTVRLVGPSIDARQVPIIAEQVGNDLAQIKDSLRVLLFDMADVQVISSMALDMCLGLRHEADAVGASTLLYGLTPELIGLLKMMNTQRMWQFVKDPAQLKRALAA
ncbi:MAG: STAS domain-containing protein [Planctomycetes bacterium]|nr:STAS domain-containing protein [Planctomycetota bacterium]